jgi:hypothetical protein
MEALNCISFSLQLLLPLFFDPNFVTNICLKHLQYEPVEITNKMQPCNRIYYSNVNWRLNMFRAAYRSSSGALNCICSLWFAYACGDWP